MKWFLRLENKIGKYAIPNLMFGIIGLYIIGTIIFQIDYRFYIEYLSLDPGAILKGQVWRLVTFLMMPPGGSNIFMTLISLYCYYMIGTVLERWWGAFRFNVYFLGGVLCTILAAFVLYGYYCAQYGPDAGRYVAFMNLAMVGTTYINFSLFIAYAFSFPNAQMLLFFVLPIPAKVLGIIELIVYAVMFIQGGTAERLMIVVSLLNVLIFFALTQRPGRYKPSEIRRRHSFQQKVKAGERANINRHRCSVCGVTSEEKPEETFRYCSKCEGNYEYCSEHLYTHAHLTKEMIERMKQPNK